MYELDITEHFSSAHKLIDYDGPCANLHGHNWKVQVFVQSDHLNSLGFAVDFRVLKKELSTILTRYDHHYLNDLPDFKDINPTSENIARNIYQHLTESFKSSGIKIAKVRVCESDTAGASYWE